MINYAIFFELHTSLDWYNIELATCLMVNIPAATFQGLLSLGMTR